MTFKYVIFRHGKLVYPVIFPEHVTHSMVRLELPDPAANGFVHPHSAGFFHIEEGVEVHERVSTSLNLGPQPDDKVWLERAMSGCNTSMFVIEEDGTPMLG